MKAAPASSSRPQAEASEPVPCASLALWVPGLGVLGLLCLKILTLVLVRPSEFSACATSRELIP